MFRFCNVCDEGPQKLSVALGAKYRIVGAGNGDTSIDNPAIRSNAGSNSDPARTVLKVK